MRIAPITYTLLHVYKDENNTVRFRDNNLIPELSRNKPLHYYDVFRHGGFIRRIYFINKSLCINTQFHGPFLDSARSAGITGAHSDDRIPLEYPELSEEREALARHQRVPVAVREMRTWRKHSMMVLYMKLFAKIKDHRKTVREVNSRILNEPYDETENYLLKIGLEKKSIYKGSKSTWKKTPEYRALQAAVVRARARAHNGNPKITYTFSIADLPIKHEDYTYTVPMFCPVFGVRLEIEEAKRSLTQMTVWRKDIRYSLTPENTCVMSSIASRMIEGTRVSKTTIAEIMTSVPDAQERWERWCQKYRVGGEV